MFYCCLLLFFHREISVGHLRKISQRGRKHVEFTNAGPKIWGGAPRKILGAKNANFGPILDPFPLWARISLEWIEISKIRKLFDWQRFLPHWAKKFSELWPTNHGDLEVQLYPENRIFQNTIFRPLGGAAPQIFYTCYRMSQVLLAYTPLRMGAPSTIFLKGGQKLAYNSAY